MDITILGSGTCVPSLVRSSCAVLLEIGSRKILFDLGAGTIRRLLEAGVTVFEISDVYFSHFHPDHTGELASFLFSNKYPDGAKRTRPLTLLAGYGFSRFFDKLSDLYGSWISLGADLLSLRELDTKGPDYVNYPNFTVFSRPMKHNPESLGYRIESGQSSFVYTGDTDVNEDLVDLARDADLLICESALPDELKTAGHLTPSQAGDIASRAGVKKLVLTHLYPETESADIGAQCRKTYAGPLVVAQDLMKFSL